MFLYQSQGDLVLVQIIKQNDSDTLNVLKP